MLANFWPAAFFANEARANARAFDTAEDEDAELIYNFEPEFAPSEGLSSMFEQLYFFKPSATAASLSQRASTAPLTLLPSNSLGKCLDGTSSGFYFLNQSSTKFVIAFDGGGECNSAASCKPKVNTPLGSSKYFSTENEFDDAGQWFLDTSSDRNPGFAHWNKVRVPYCSQDLHMGTKTTADASTFGLFFSGNLVFEAILDELDALGLRGATDILLTGESAGGIAVWPKLDATAARYPNARVSGAPVAGFYFYSDPYTGPNATGGGLASFSPAGLDELYALYAPSLNSACVAAFAGDASPCMLSNFSLPFVQAPVFVTESLSDSVQLTAHDDIPEQFRTLAPELAYIDEWAANMSVALQPVLGAGSSPAHGGFAAACWIHTSFTSTAPLIKGLSFLQAAAQWYERSGDYKIADECGAPFCNPTCP